MGCRGRVLTRGRVPQDGLTALSAAAKHGSLEVVRALAAAGSDKNAMDQVWEGGGGWGHTRCFFMGVAVVRRLTVSVVTKVGQPCKVERALVHSPPGPGAARFLDNGVLNAAAHVGGARLGRRVRVLTRARDGDTPQDGDTALHFAAHNGFPDVIKFLVETGANPNTRGTVRQGRGGVVGCTHGVCVSWWGLQEGCFLLGVARRLLSACCQG